MAAATETREVANVGLNGSHMTYNQTVLPSLSQGQFPYTLANGGQPCQPKGDLSQAFGQMNIGFNGPQGVLPYQVTGTTANPLNSYYQLPDGRIVPSRLTPSAMHQGSDNANSSAQSQYLAYMNQLQANANMGQALSMVWNGGQHNPRSAKSVPDLAAPRRNSFSSNEENGPRTPFYNGYAQASAPAKITCGDSPQTWHTPSPQNNAGSPFQIAKSPNGQYFFTDFSAVCIQDPAIPRPIPAIFSGERGRGTLERSLQNPLNTTNVYIRGLHPNTTDDMLHTYGERFGKISSAKSMLEQDTGNCKGFGFIRYFNFSDGENCIRAFFHWGYEAKWARTSHNEKLKTLGDDNNTNLYVSNLPMDFNEHSLMACFEEYEVMSAKILRDGNGMSRGVGFARFATPDICRKVIDQYNGMKIGDDGNLLSIRFADTPEQKRLKQITAERRQYKATEYNTAAYSPGSPYASIAAPVTYNSPLQARAPATAWNPNTQLPSVIAPYQFATYPSPAPANATTRHTLVARDLDGSDTLRTAVDIKVENVKPEGLTPRSGNIQSPSKSETGSKIDTHKVPLGKCEPSSSPVKPSKYSPAKASPVKVQTLRD